MTPERWSRIRETLHAAAGKDAAARAQYLDESCAGDAELRQEVERLLVALDRSGSFLEPTAPPKAEPNGGRIGPYLILEEAGQGGMGTVYRAVREDDYRQQVALKVVKRDVETNHLLERFRRERQALALLNHPNIARLLDGGAMAGGRPYLVMEWVEGSPIGEYCAARKLGLRERLKFFQTVCHAVAHAHANLVVHRDLKPSNILVTDEGIPKLLDFGIAKILTPEADGSAAAPTLLEAAALTPDYASPEQVRGEAMTTATDIYSLGAVLYELLTGVRPHRFQTRTRPEIERVVCVEEVSKPSEATGPGGVPARELRGDLDNIVLKAMEKAPARRYSHAQELAADVQLFLTGRPVLARNATFQYRAAKFVRRNKTLVAASAAIVLALTLGLTAALWQAREARREREIAERRFELARKVAASLLYDIHDEIEDLAGATKARELLLGKSIGYLDALSQEASNSPLLQIDLANAYRRAATLQGLNGASNLGQQDAALVSLQKAVRLLEQALTALPGSVEARRDLAITHRQFVGIGADRPEKLQHAQASLSIVEGLRRERPGDVALLDDLQKSEFNMGRAFAGLTRYPEAAAYYRKAIAHGSSSSAQNLALDHKSLGGVLILMGALDEALQEYGAAAAMDERRVSEKPDDGRAKLDLSYDYADWGLILLKQNQPAAAVQKYQQAEALRLTMVAADPRDARAATGLVSVEWRMGIAMSRAGDRKGAEQAFQAAVREAERMIATLPDPRVGKGALADANWNIGRSYKDDWVSCAKARPWLLSARGLFRDLHQPTQGVDSALAECGADTAPAPAVAERIR